MTRFLKFLALFALLLASSCNNEEELTSYELNLDPNQSSALFINSSEVLGDMIQVQVIANGIGMERLYVVRDEEFYLDPSPYLVGDLRDGSIAIPAGPDERFETTLEFPVQQFNVDYHVWATSTRGDHRDVNKHAVTGLGTITITGYDQTGYVPLLSECKSYSTELQVQSSNGATTNFISTTGYKHSVLEGSEFSHYWDIGYHYDEMNGISLYSGFSFPKDAILALGQIDPINLNETYFTVRPDLDEADFNAIRDIELYRWEEQDTYTFMTTTASSQSISNLQVTDIVEFLDTYGQRGFLQIQRETGSIDPDPTVRIPVQLLVFRRNL